MTQEVEVKTFFYSAFGISFKSQMEIPELSPTEPSDDAVEIEFGHAPDDLDDATDRGGVYAARDGEFLLRLDGVGRFHVKGGSKITIAPTTGVGADDLRVFLLGSSFGALLHQRGLLALHASAVVVEGQAVLFAGVSGAGKSTTAAAFQARGYKLLADDLIAIDLTSGKPTAYPGLIRLKLWRDAVAKLDHDPNSLKRVRPGTIHRFVLPITEFCEKPVPVRAIFQLGQWNKDEFSVERVEDTGRFQVLLANTYRARFLDGLKTRTEHFKVASAVSQGVPVFQVFRPEAGFLIEELLDTILEHLP